MGLEWGNSCAIAGRPNISGRACRWGLDTSRRREAVVYSIFFLSAEENLGVLVHWWRAGHFVVLCRCGLCKVDASGLEDP